MVDSDDTLLEPDFDTGETPQQPVQEERQIDYGILIFSDTQGEQGIQILGKEKCTINDLVSLTGLAVKKLDAMWNVQHDPTAQAILRDISDLKQSQTATSKALKAVMDILKGVNASINDINTKLDTQ